MNRGVEESVYRRWALLRNYVLRKSTLVWVLLLAIAFTGLWYRLRYEDTYTNRKGRVYNCLPPYGSPRFARGTAIGAPTRFPLLAGGTLRKGFQFRLFL